MRIGIQTWGSNGDVRPFIALADGLTKAGHEICVAVTSVENRDYSHFGQAMGFEVCHVGEVDLEASRSVAEKIVRRRDTIKQARDLFAHVFNPGIDEMFAASQRLCGESDLVIGHFLHHPLVAAAEVANTTRVGVFTAAALVPSRHVTPPQAFRLGQNVNRFWWWLADLALSKYLRPRINQLRQREGLPAIGRVMQEVWSAADLSLICNSPSLVKRPPDWHDSVQLCGFFNIPEQDDSWEMPEELRLFLESGPAPVFITFGSMADFEPDPSEIARLLVDAATRAGCRAIIQARWSEVRGVEIPGHVFPVGLAPHKHLFPHCALVVHHGGAGTTQSATLAGCPSVVVTFGFDQPYWAKTLRERGLAHTALHRRSLHAGKLAEAIRKALADPLMKPRAEEIGARMSGEDGIARAVEILEQRYAR